MGEGITVFKQILLSSRYNEIGVWEDGSECGENDNKAKLSKAKQVKPFLVNSGLRKKTFVRDMKVLN